MGKHNKQISQAYFKHLLFEVSNLKFTRIYYKTGKRKFFVLPKWIIIKTIKLLSNIFGH